MWRQSIIDAVESLREKQFSKITLITPVRLIEMPVS